MQFTTDELLAWASRHEDDEWVTLRQQRPFSYRVTDSGIAYIPQSGKTRNVPRNELDSFCEEFQQSGSDSPGAYPDRWHKSYSLPLIKRFLKEHPTADGYTGVGNLQEQVPLDNIDYREINRTARDMVAEELERHGVKNLRDARDLNRTVLKGDGPGGDSLTFVIKSKTKGSWQGTLRDGDPDLIRPDVFWIFVDLGARPDFFVVPDSWIRNDIQVAHAAYLARHGGNRAEGGTSSHHAIQPERIEQWQNRWDLLTGGRSGSDPSYWALLADPRVYDIENAVRIMEVDWWTTRRSAVTAGDLVAIWRGAGNDGRRGVVALGEVLTDPEERRDNGNPFWLRPEAGDEIEPRVLVRYLGTKSLPLWVGDNGTAVLEELSVFRARGGTVFRITRDQWQSLAEACGDKNSLSAEVDEPMPVEARKNRGQGYGLSSAERRAVENARYDSSDSLLQKRVDGSSRRLRYRLL